MTDIPLRWVGTDATGAAASSVKKNIDSVGKAASGAQGGVKGLTDAMDKMSPAGKSAQGALSGMESAAKSLLGGLGGVAAAMGVGAVVGFGGMMIGAAVDMGKAAEASARLRSAMDGLAQQAGSSSAEIISKLQQASGGAIAEYDLMLAANKSMMLGVASSADEMGKLMEIARTRGVAMGLSTTQAFNDLVTGLGRGSALILDNLGIVVDAESANAAYAESIGKTVKELTEQEKKQALVNATLKEATGAMLPAASSYERMAAAMADMKVELGELFSPAIAAAAEMIASGIRAVNDSLESSSLEETNARLEELHTTMGNLTANNAVVDSRQIDVAEQMVEQYTALGRVLRGDLAAANAEAAAAQREYNIAVREGYDLKYYTDEVNRTQVRVEALRDQIEASTTSANQWQYAIDSATQVLAEQNAQLMVGSYGWRAQQMSAGAAAASIETVTGSVSEASQELIEQAEALALVDGAIDDYLAGLERLLPAMANSVGAGAALAMFDAAEEKARATIAAFEAMGWSQAQIALVMRTMGNDMAAGWSEIINGAAEAASAADDTGTAFGGLYQAAVSTAGISSELAGGLVYVANAGLQAADGVAAAGAAASHAQGGFGALAAAARDASAAMLQAQIDQGQNRLKAAYMGAVGTLGASGAASQYAEAAADLEAYRVALSHTTATQDEVDFAMAAYEEQIRANIQSQVEAARKASGLGGAAGSASGKLSDLAGKAGDLSGKFQSILDQIPGLKGTSEVTDKQMSDAGLGIPQNFADDYLRRLTDEVLNGVDWAGVDIGDAAQRAGIDPSLPAQTILAMFKNAWADSSLFANAANLDLINMDAVKAGLAQASSAASGKANIDALFGIGDESTVASVASLGLSVQNGLAQWLSENGMPDAGARLASALSDGVTAGGVAVDGGLNSWLNSESGGNALNGYTKELSTRLSDDVYITPTLLPPKAPDAPAATEAAAADVPSFASGTTWFGGGWARVGEHGPEMARLAAGPVYNARRTRDMTAAGATVVVNAVINNKLDEAQFAQMLRRAMRRAQVG